MKIVIFKSRNRKITRHLNFHICGQKVVPVDSVKYLGLTLQSDLCWKTHLTSLEKKLSRSIGFLLKIRYYVPKFLLRNIYYSIFNSCLIYVYEVWGQNQNNVHAQRLQKLQEKTVCLINFETNPRGTRDTQIRSQLYHKFKLPTMGNIHLNQDQSMHGICTKET